jgi:hypothetical protein
MPRPRPLPDLTGVDPTELQLTILAVLDQRGVGPEFRQCMRGVQLGDILELCGGAPAVTSPRRISVLVRVAHGQPAQCPHQHLRDNQIARDVLAHRALVDVEQPRRPALGKTHAGEGGP